jgi:hypothetical protein
VPFGTTPLSLTLYAGGCGWTLARAHGRSMEAEVRAILHERLMPITAEHGLGSRIRARFRGLEGDLELPDRSAELPRAAEFDR